MKNNVKERSSLWTGFVARMKVYAFFAFIGLLVVLYSWYQHDESWEKISTVKKRSKWLHSKESALYKNIDGKEWDDIFRLYGLEKPSQVKQGELAHDAEEEIVRRFDIWRILRKAKSIDTARIKQLRDEGAHHEFVGVVSVFSIVFFVAITAIDLFVVLFMSGRHVVLVRILSVLSMLWLVAMTAQHNPFGSFCKCGYYIGLTLIPIIIVFGVYWIAAGMTQKEKMSSNAP